MGRDHVHRLDLNLLLAFDALITERNVTRAAERMLVGQSAMSSSLSRLRTFFDDPLLVRDGRSLVPTPRALELVAPLRNALDLIDDTLRTSREFKPRTDARTFTFMASDYVLLIVLGRLLAELGAEAPNLRFRVRPIAVDHAEQVRRGQVDLLIMPEDVVSSEMSEHSETLFTDRVVCAVDVDHPEVGAEITEEQLRTLPLISYDGNSLTTPYELRFRELGLDRATEIATQSIVVQPFMLRGSRCMALLPERLGRRFRAQGEIRLLVPPVPLEPLREGMYWAPRNDDDPGHRWLRDRTRRAAAGLDG